MVCISCIVIPFVLWFFHKFIQPWLGKYLPWGKLQDEHDQENKNGQLNCPFKSESTNAANGSVPEVKEEILLKDKKDD